MNQGLLAALGSVVAAFCGWMLLRDQTVDTDETGEDVGRIDLERGSSSLGARAVEILSRHVGEKGQGKRGTPGYHRSPLIDQILRGVYNDHPELLGKAWCARALRWAYEMAARELGLPRPFAEIKGALSMVSEWKRGPFRSHILERPRVGAALLLGDQHATLIAKVLTDQAVITVEGNHGDAIAHVRRTIRPGDTIVDVEGCVRAMEQRAHAAPAVAGWLVDLELLDAELLG